MKNLKVATFRVANIPVEYDSNSQQITFDSSVPIDVSEVADIIEVLTEIKNIKDRQDMAGKS